MVFTNINLYNTRSNWISICQKTNIIPFTLPNKEISGETAHSRTMFYIKHNHGK